MTHHVNILLACFLSVGSLDAQSLWQWQNPLPQGAALFSVHMIDPDNALAVGDAGTIARTSNGGSHWTFQNYVAGVNGSLRKMFFLDQDVGFVVGDSGTVLRTTDRGTHWTRQNSGTTNTLNDVVFVDRLTGTTVGALGTILRTTDGGSTWVNRPSGTLAELYGVCFSDSTKGFIVEARDSLLISTDQGMTWTGHWIAASGYYFLNSICFLDANIGVAVGSRDAGPTWPLPSIIRTTDGGTSWTELLHEFYFNAQIYAVTFSDEATGVAVGGNGRGSLIYVTTDAGATWIRQMSDTVGTLFGISAGSPTVALAVGYAGTIERTTDAGQSWIDQSTFVTHNDLASIAFADSNTATVVGGLNTMMRTTDGGATWLPQPALSVYGIDRVRYYDAHNGIAVGNFGKVYFTTNAGASWIDRSILTDDEIFAASYIDQSTVVAVGRNSAIFKTTNGGVTWLDRSFGTTNIYSGVFFPDAHNGFAAGTYRDVQAGIVIHTTDGGNTWTQQNVGTSQWLQDAWFANADTGVVTGIGGAVLRTTNAGLTWTALPGTTISGNCLAFHENRGFIVGQYGQILATTDGGATWTREGSGTENWLTSISFSGSQAFVVGNWGTMLRRTSSVVSAPPASRNPRAFLLEQNYPNPFNPSTTISFSLPQSSNVTLKIFDILGREVATLVNGHESAGTHSATWNATNVASGVYFYTIQAGEFTQTKKLAVVR